MNIFIGHIENNLAVLNPEESWHCAKVLRKKAGDEIHVIDGKGNFYNAVLSLVNEKKCLAEVKGSYSKTKTGNYYLHLAIAPTKQIDRIEWMVEKAVEIGIDEISFVQCKNSERTVVKTDRINKIVESAVKQSLQAYIPKVNELVSFKEFVSKQKLDQNFIAHCFTANTIHLKTYTFKEKKTLALVGPEGDFTKEEVDLAQQNGFEGITLGANRLRTETAGLYICQTVSILS